MSDGFRIAPEDLARFGHAAGRAELGLDRLHSRAQAAALAPGAFTRTAAGQICDQAHADLVEGAGTLIGLACGLLRAVANVTAAALDGYRAIDTDHAAALTEPEQRPGFPRREPI